MTTPLPIGLRRLRGRPLLESARRDWALMESFQRHMLERAADAVRPWWAEKQTSSDGETVWVERKQ